MKSTKSVLTQFYRKQIKNKHQTGHFRRIRPFGTAPAKKNNKKHNNTRLGHFGIVDHSVDLLLPDLSNKQTKEWKGINRSNKNKKKIWKCMKANEYQCHMAAYCIYHRPGYFVPAAERVEFPWTRQYRTLHTSRVRGIVQVKREREKRERVSELGLVRTSSFMADSQVKGH